MVNCQSIHSAWIITLLISTLFPQPNHTQEKTWFIKGPGSLIEKEKQEKLSFSISETSGIKLSALWLIRFYQNFISSQHDNKQMCTFVPSCSRFGVSAIKYCGILKGVLITSDRLQRCNNTGSWNYVIDSHTKKKLDPVAKYKIINDTINKSGKNNN